MDWRLAKRAFGRLGGEGGGVPHKFNLTLFGFHTVLPTAASLYCYRYEVLKGAAPVHDDLF